MKAETTKKQLLLVKRQGTEWKEQGRKEFL